MSNPLEIRTADITGLLLAGGMGRRMGGVDKGLLALDGAPMASRVLERLRPQVGALLINANRQLEQWRAYGLPVVSDEIGGYSGPLAGIHAGLLASTTPWLLTVPCDSPFFPDDLARRLSAALATSPARVAVARCDGRLQPVFALLRRDVLPVLEAYLHGGGRRLETWFAEVGCVAVDFEDMAAFANINTPEDLAATQGKPAGD
ncbi:MAG: molybdenum cofactor guanylyltransferase MobA [Sulfuritalea sp.]|nr:molybdenum cofactor guanylyltransferase MobA [Sulfuritalea sp.]